MKGIKQLNGSEIVAFNYWMTLKRVLAMGIPWDVVDKMSEETIVLLVAFEEALETREQEDYAANKFL